MQNADTEPFETTEYKSNGVHTILANECCLHSEFCILHYMKPPSTTRRIIETLAEQHPHADTELHYTTPFELLVATILSAQSTDARVNMVTPALFKRYPDAAALAKARQAALEKQIVSTGFFRQKSKALIGMAKALVAEHGGQVPANMELLTTLPGVGRKTANVVLGTAYGIASGVVVDTHVQRVTGRLGLRPEKMNAEQSHTFLARLFPPADYGPAHLNIIRHGREICHARKPECEKCVLRDLCDYYRESRIESRES